MKKYVNSALILTVFISIAILLLTACNGEINLTPGSAPRLPTEKPYTDTSEISASDVLASTLPQITPSIPPVNTDNTPTIPEESHDAGIADNSEDRTEHTHTDYTKPPYDHTPTTEPTVPDNEYLPENSSTDEPGEEDKYPAEDNEEPTENTDELPDEIPDDTTTDEAPTNDDIPEVNETHHNRLISAESFDRLLAHFADSVGITDTEEYTVSGIPARGYPDYYGGAFINASGNLVVALTDPSHATKELLIAITENDTLSFIDADFSYSHLVETMSLIYEYMENDLDYGFSIESSEIDDFGNRIIVSISDTSEETVALFKEAVTDSASVLFILALTPSPTEIPPSPTTN